jgi:anaerobic magnesium-protoporphyrin IX monomethyl ester cyclase
VFVNVVLIAPYPDITALGVRYLSAALEKDGIESRILFIPAPSTALRLHAEFYYPYSAAELDRMVEFCRGADLIGLSLMTHYFERACQISRRLRESLAVPLVWGGVHPTACPEESLEHADFVCRGEGEIALVELCRAIKSGGDPRSLANFWSKKDGRVVSNPVRPLIEDLDQLPFPDYRFDRHVVLDRDRRRLLTLDETTTARYLEADAITRARNPSSPHGKAAFYQIIATRGCPHHCSFCYNNEYQKLYGRRHFLRRRSVDHIIAELKAVKESSPIFQHVVFCDDSFFAAGEVEIRDFADRYRDEIGFPFHCLGSPQTISANKLDALVKVGLSSISMGIQSGSEATNRIYERHFREKQVIDAVRIIHDFIPRLAPPALDFIIDNPFETTVDELASLDLINRLPRPYHLCLGSLVFYPGTPLYERAKNEGIVVDELNQVYRKEYHHKDGTYVNLLFYLSAAMIPIALLRILEKPGIVKILNFPLFHPAYRLFFRTTRVLRLCGRWLKSRLSGDRIASTGGG